eukprot:g2703.t1
MAETIRQTQTVGGSNGNEFRAPPGNSTICQLAFYVDESLKGIKVTYSDNTFQRIGRTSGSSYRSLDTTTESIRSITVFTDNQSTKVLGIHITQRNRISSLFGSQTEHYRTVSLPRENRLVGINGRHLSDCVIAISFTYLAATAAFEPHSNTANASASQRARESNDDEPIPSRRESTWADYAQDIGSSLVQIGGALGVAFAVGYGIKKWWDKKENSSDDDDDDSSEECRNPY